MANILSSTNWQGTRVYDKDNNDLTKENAKLVPLLRPDCNYCHYK